MACPQDLKPKSKSKYPSYSMPRFYLKDCNDIDKIVEFIMSNNSPSTDDNESRISVELAPERLIVNGLIRSRYRRYSNDEQQ